MQFEYFDVWTKSAEATRASINKAGAAVFNEMRECAVESFDESAALARDMMEARSVLSAMDVHNRHAGKVFESAVAHSRAIVSAWVDLGTELTRLPAARKVEQATDIVSSGLRDVNVA